MEYNGQNTKPLESNEDLEGTGTVHEQILDWSEVGGRPMWQRHALKLIIQSHRITDKDIDNLCTILEDEVKKPPQQNVEPDPLTGHDINIKGLGSESKKDVTITGISNVKNVNRLAEGPGLNFSHEGITVIYGANGSGKSGYTRILKNACSARFCEDKILPNVFDTENESATGPSAIISYVIGKEVDEKQHEWQPNNDPNKDLSSVYVLDRKCIDSIFKKNEHNDIVFKPPGLDILTKLGEICTKIDGRIRKKIEDAKAKKSENEKQLRNLKFHDETYIEGVFKSLSCETTEEDLKKYEFTEKDEQELKNYTEICSGDKKERISYKSLIQSKLEALQKNINEKKELITQEKLDAILQQKQNSEKAVEKSNRVEENMKCNKLLEGTYTDETWKSMLKAAKEYSKVAYKDKDWLCTNTNTETGVRCVLCQQELDEYSKKRLQSFEEYISSDLAKQAEDEKNKYQDLYRQSIDDNNEFTIESDTMAYIENKDKDVHTNTTTYLERMELQRQLFKKIVDGEEDKASFSSLDSFNCFNPLIEELKTDISTLELDNDKSLELKNKLEDKKLLNANIYMLEAQLKCLKDIDFYTKCQKKAESGPITKCSSTITSNVISSPWTKSFKTELEEFGSHLNCKPKFKGDKGTSYYTLELENTNEATNKTTNKATNKYTGELSNILSEGEQTCLGIAAFFADLSTSSHKSSLIFDDPVSSLDHHYRDKIAERLVKEAENRQVIVFTHDLAFLHEIQDYANEKVVNFSFRHLKKGGDNTTGNLDVEHPWIGKTLEQRIESLTKESEKLKSDDSDYDRRVGDFYSNLRACWERALEDIGFNKSVVRYRKSVIPKRVKEIMLTNIHCEEWCEAYNKCCRHTSAHDDSIHSNRGVPTYDEMKKDIEALENWIKNVIEERKKNVTSTKKPKNMYQPDDAIVKKLDHL